MLNNINRNDTMTGQSKDADKPTLEAVIRTDIITGERDVFRFRYNTRVLGSTNMSRKVHVHMLSSDDSVELFMCLKDHATMAREELAGYVNWLDEGAHSIVSLDMDTAIVVTPTPPASAATTKQPDAN